MKIGQIFIVFVILISAGCSGFQTRNNPPTPTPKPATPRPVEKIQTETISNLESLPQPSIFNTSWNNPARFMAALNPFFQDAFTDWLPLSEYLIDVSISSDLKQIEGWEEILVVNSTDQELETIALHNYPALFGSIVEISQFTVNGKEIEPSFGPDEASIEITLDPPILPSQAVVISLQFAYTMPVEASSNYLIFGTSPGLVTLAHFYPMLAAYDGFGWHTETSPNYGDVTYSDAALYQVRVHTPAGITTVASGTQIYNGQDNGMIVQEYVLGPARDFYLAAGKSLITREMNFGDLTITCTAHQASSKACQSAIQISAQALEFFSDAIGPYPYSEFDIVATHTEALGVEYPGVIAINRNLFSLDPDQPNAEQAKYFNSTLVHEVGHQWFYNLIGNDQVNQPWLDEATTQYLTYLYFDQRVGKLAGAELLQSFETRVSRVEDASQPIGMPVKAYDGNEYSAIIYGKGPLFFYELEKTFGTDVMQQFLSTMYQDYQWQNIQSENIESALESACACQVYELFSEWVGEVP